MEARTNLTSGINNLSSILLPLILNNLAERILDRGIITLYEVAVHELHRK